MQPLKGKAGALRPHGRSRLGGRLRSPRADGDGGRAAQQTYTVTRPEACTPADCSLREAVLAANFDSIVDRIQLAPGEYTLTIPGVGDALEGDLDITQNISIENTGSAPATINGNGLVTGDRVLHIRGGSTVLKDVTVTGGIAPADGDTFHRGGGVRVNPGATFTLNGGSVIGNRVTLNASEGGGIFNQGQLYLVNAIVESNFATNDAGVGGFGGGIFTKSPGTTSPIGSIIRGNEAAFGGGLAGTGDLILYESRVRDNRAFLGGGAYLGNGADFFFENANIHGNIAEGEGGAIRARNSTVKLSNSTVSANVSGTNGGGISVQDDAGAPVAKIRLANTILAKNTDNATDGTIYPDCHDATGGLFVTDGYNILGNSIGCDLHAITGDQIGNSVTAVDPLLQSPGFNGAALSTHLTQALLPGSPAINRGSPATSGPAVCADTDSRGAPRKGRCDIGAYERLKCKGVLVNRVGTSGDDSSATQALLPTDAADGFLGLQNGDSLKGKAGDDGLCGNGSGDILKGGKDDDKLVGGGGGDHLVGGPGHDLCIGGGGTDTATGCEVKRQIP